MQCVQKLARVRCGVQKLARVKCGVQKLARVKYAVQKLARANCKVWCTEACTCKVWSSSIQQLNQAETSGKLKGKLSYLHSKLHYGSQSAKLNKSSNKSGVFEQILVDHIPG